MSLWIKKLIEQLKQIDERLGRIEERFDEFEDVYSFKTYKEYVPGSECTYANDGELLEETIRLVVEVQTASASFLQRRMRVGYARVARLLDLMEEKGIIGPSRGANPRNTLVNEYPIVENGKE